MHRDMLKIQDGVAIVEKVNYDENRLFLAKDLLKRSVEGRG